MPVAAVNGIEIYFEVHGSGAPLLDISGSGNDLRSFETLSYDQRGFGQTSMPDGDFTMADCADDAAALVRSMGCERCHVMATSFGGMVALNLAVRHPGLIDLLVLCCTSPGGEAASYPLEELGRMDPDEAIIGFLGAGS